MKKYNGGRGGFEDDFQAITYYLSVLFRQKQVLMPISLFQKNISSLIREDRYTIVSKHNKPKYVIVDARIMEKVRRALINMGYIDDKFIIEAIPDEPKPRLVESPDRITFHIEDN